MPIHPHGDGAYRVWVYAGADIITGQPRRKTLVVHGTHRDAELAEARLLTLHGRQPGTGARTLGNALDAFIAHKEVSVEENTAENYRYQLGYIPDTLKAVSLEDIDVEHIEALYGHLRRRGAKSGGPLSAKSVRHVHAVIYGTLELARRRKWITSNPAADAEVPAIPDREPSPTPAASIVRLIRLAADIHPAFPAYIRASACVGSRRSEMHGLRWSGVLWERRKIVLRDVIVRADGEWKVKPYTKTGGQRVLTIDEGTLAALRSVHAEALHRAVVCGVALPEKGFVFSHDMDGARPWVPRTTAKWFARACAAAGIEEGTRIHDLRHLAATHLIDEGLPLPAVSARLGHASNSITLDIYAGRVPRSDLTAADIMGQLLDGEE